MRNFNDEVEEEIERVAAQLERQMDREQAKYEAKITKLEAAMLEAHGLAVAEISDAHHEGFGAGMAHAQDGIEERIAAAAVRGAIAALRDMADQIDRGPTFRMAPSIISALVRERADDLEAEATKESTDGR